MPGKESVRLSWRTFAKSGFPNSACRSILPKPPLRFAAIAQALQSPLEIRISRSDKTVQLFYEYHARTRVGGKWLCIVVKYPSADGFVVTAYLTDRLKEGETIWPTK